MEVKETHLKSSHIFNFELYLSNITLISMQLNSKLFVPKMDNRTKIWCVTLTYRCNNDLQILVEMKLFDYI
jgi:hypothetical protein